MNSDGTYSFIANQPGIYVYNVPVCNFSTILNCSDEILTITVITPFEYPPVAQTDNTVTMQGNPVTLNTLANDIAEITVGGLNPASVTIVSGTAPDPITQGSLSVNHTTGEITFNPVPSFIGEITYTYQVCDNTQPTALCATAIQQVKVLAMGSPNFILAADDYNETVQGVHLSVSTVAGVLANDKDIEGYALFVTTTSPNTIPGKGTLTFHTDGSYDFDPVSTFRGGVGFQYTVCDNGSPSSCANATLYLLVKSYNTNPDINATFINVPVSGNVHTNDDVITGTTYSPNPTLTSYPSGSTAVITMNSDGTYVFTANQAGVYNYNVHLNSPDLPFTTCLKENLTITVTDPLSNINPPITNTDHALTLSGDPITLNTLANDAAGNIGGTLVPSSVTIVPGTEPNPVTVGSLNINHTNGDITFTPVSTFSGSVTYSYSVCDNSQPALCATATQVIKVLLTGTTDAVDDFNTTPEDSTLTVSAALGVLSNDTDPEGDKQTVITTSPMTVPGKGTVTIAPDGSYVFVPEHCFSGPVSFPYTIVDNGTPVSYASATLYIEVEPLAITLSTYGPICSNGVNINLTGLPAGGVWTGTGVNGTTFNPSVAGAGTHTLTYTFTDASSCATLAQTTITVNPIPTPVIKGSPNNNYNVHVGDSDQYSTPLVAGDLYSWSASGEIGLCSGEKNCISVHFINPCCVYGEWTIYVTETIANTGCTTTATKNVLVDP